VRFRNTETGDDGNCGKVLSQQLVDVGLLSEAEKAWIYRRRNDTWQAEQATNLRGISGGVENQSTPWPREQRHAGKVANV